MSEKDAARFREHVECPVSVVEATSLNNAFEVNGDLGKRSDFLFVGSVFSETAPNFDALEWFISRVWPLVRGRLPEVKLNIAGYWDERVSRRPSAEGVTYLGAVDDLAPLYRAHRVFIAPTRFAAGIPLKIIEAVSHGIPVFSSELLCEQLGWQKGVQLEAQAIDNPYHFASELVSFYSDFERLAAVRSASAELFKERYSQENFRRAIAAVFSEKT